MCTILGGSWKYFLNRLLSDSTGEVEAQESYEMATIISNSTYSYHTHNWSNLGDVELVWYFSSWLRCWRAASSNHCQLLVLTFRMDLLEESIKSSDPRALQVGRSSQATKSLLMQANLRVRESVVQGVAIKQIAIFTVDDVQGNIHSRNNTRAVKGLTKRYDQAEKAVSYTHLTLPTIYSV